MYVYKTCTVAGSNDIVIVFPVPGSVIVNVLLLPTWSSFEYILSNRLVALPKFSHITKPINNTFLEYVATGSLYKTPVEIVVGGTLEKSVVNRFCNMTEFGLVDIARNRSDKKGR